MASKDLGKRIQELRQTAGLTQDGLSDKANLAYSTLAKIERGAIKSPSVFTISAIAKGLGVSMEDLLSMPMASDIKFFFCDMNGVLVTPREGAIAEIAKHSELNVNRIESVLMRHMDLIDGNQMSLGDFNKLMQKELKWDGFDWHKLYMDNVQPLKPMQEVLKQVSKSIPVGILSNTVKGYIKELRANKVLPEISYAAIIDSSEIGAVKPDPKIYREAIKKAGVKPEEILFADDRQPNLVAAREQGWKTVLVDTFRPERAIDRIKQLGLLK